MIMKKIKILALIFILSIPVSAQNSREKTYSFSLLSNFFGGIYLATEVDRPNSKHFSDIYRFENSLAVGVTGIEVGKRLYWLDKKGSTEGLFSEMGVGPRFMYSEYDQDYYSVDPWSFNVRLHFFGYKNMSKSGRFANSFSLGVNTDFFALMDGSVVPGQMFPVFMRWQVGFVR